MEKLETMEVMILDSGLQGTILEEDSSCGENFTVYGIETRRKLPDGSVRREKDWYFASEFIRYTAYRIPKKEAV